MSTSNGTHAASSTDEAIDLLYSWMPPMPAPQPLPEAAFSLTLKGTLDGQEALLTARGMTAEEFRRNLEAIRGLLDPKPASPPQLSPQQHNAAAMHKRVSDFCQVHNVQMKRHENAKGVWYSHFVEGKHCKGR